MLDSFSRDINYLRVSVTDLCNLRCLYCMPECGVIKSKHSNILGFEEIAEICGAAAGEGISKLRITGGEPLVRRGIAELCSMLSAIGGIRELTMTTNGILLSEMVVPLRDAGVRRFNISLDTLDADKFKRLTRVGSLDAVLRGLEAVKKAGLYPIKLNTVLIKGLNDDEIPAFVELTRHEEVHVRFIELMPVGEGLALWEDGFLSNTAVTERVPELVACDENGGVAKLYTLPGGVGRVGLINPVSKHFCTECNRLRLTADGKLKPCLHSEAEIALRGLHGTELRDAIRYAIAAKPRQHGGLSSLSPSGAGRDMNEIGG